MTSRQDQQLQARRDNLEAIKKLGLNPYPSRSLKDLQFDTITHNFAQYEGKIVTTAGRVSSMRQHGALTFFDLLDETGKIQLIAKEDALSPTSASTQTLGYAHLPLIDLGDFVQVTGEVMKSQTGAISILAKELRIITKATLALPNTWFGLKDVEERFRKRYLDLILNREVSVRLKQRSKIITSIRHYLDSLGMLEVETPTLQPVYGGGFARPFATHHNALDTDLYLRISDEMYLKRLIVGGYEKVYEITKVFRNEGVDHDHNPEFTMFEAQIAYQDYTYGMDLIESIIEQAALDTLGTTEFEYQGSKISVKKPWKHLRVVEAIKEYTGVNPLDWDSLDVAVKAAQQLVSDPKKLKELSHMHTVGEVIAFVFEETVEEKLIQPTIIYDYPVEISPLAKKCADPRFTERFEMFAFGSELGNNYTELNDPDDLYQRFVAEKKREKAGFDEAHQTDYDYLTAIQHGFPPTCGIAIGIDRLVMLLTNAVSIREVIAFPLLRPEVSKVLAAQKSIPTTDIAHTVDSSIKAVFPGMFYAVTVIDGVDIRKSDSELKKLTKEIISAHTHDLDKIGDFKAISEYRKLFKATGAWKLARRPSPEALHRRLATGKGIYNINTAVDAYNLAVIETGVGLGGFDGSKLKFPVTLRLTKAGEQMHLLGDDTPTTVNEGEIAYADAEKLITLDLNYRDIDATKITEATKQIILYADGAPRLTEEEVVSALQKGAEYITRFCGGNISQIEIVR